MMTTTARVAAAFMLTAGLGWGLAACSPSSEEAEPTPTTATTAAPTPTPTPTPSPTPTPTPEPTVEEQHIAQAQQTIVDYHAAVNQMGIDGFGTWIDKVALYWGHPDVRVPRGEAYQAAAEAGESFTGQVVVDQMTSIGYTPDPTGSGHEQVRLEYCSDNSGVTLFDGSGAVIEASSPPRFIWDVMMQHQDSGLWTINEMTPHIDRVC